MSLAIGVDIGGTKVFSGVVDENGTIVESLLRPTPTTDPSETEQAISEVVRELSSRHEVVAVGIGAAGWFDRECQRIRFAPHLAWRDEPLRDRLEKVLGMPVHVDNDAHATAWAEYRFGAGKGEDTLVCITLGSGIGTGIVLDGKIFRGHSGIGPELGHMILMPDGRRCGCGNRGCWERYCSGYAMAATAREIASASPMTATRLLELAGTIEQITGPVVTEAALDGDPVALECFDEVGKWLGIGLANVVAAFDPGTIVIGGGLSAAGDLLLDPARQSFKLSLSGRGHRPRTEIRLAELGPQAGLVGAADLARC